MLREHWGCKVKEKIYIENATQTEQRGAEASWAGVPVLLEGG